VPQAGGRPGLVLGAGWGELFCVGEEVGGAGVERLGDFEDVCEAGVAVSALDAADVGAVEVAEFGDKATKVMVGRPSLGAEGVSPRIQVRVDPTLATALRKRARREKRSVSEVARTALREYLDRAA
jgi:hypothetical protein